MATQETHLYSIRVPQTMRKSIEEEVAKRNKELPPWSQQVTINSFVLQCIAKQLNGAAHATMTVDAKPMVQTTSRKSPLARKRRTK